MTGKELNEIFNKTRRTENISLTVEQVKELLANQLNLDPQKITATSKIVEDLGADSLDVVELLMTLEEECGIVVSDEDAVKIVTVGDIVTLIENNGK